MLGILAQSLMIAARTEHKVWVRDHPPTDAKRSADRYFWRGRKWRQIDLDKL